MMSSIAELSTLVRVQVKLPVGLELATNEFREGWNFANADIRCLRKKIGELGWTFMKVPCHTVGSGVGDTSQEAIAGALKLALRHISDRFNAVGIERIDLTHYPWFFLAKIRITPYLIQQGVFLLPSNTASIAGIADRPRHYPDLRSAMPQANAIASRKVQATFIAD